MTVVNKSGGTGNELYWLITNIDMNDNTQAISLTATQITFRDLTGGNTSFDWITRTNMVVTDDSGFFIAYGTTGRGFAYRYSTDPSDTSWCINMSADTPLSTISYRNVPDTEYNYSLPTTVW